MRFNGFYILSVQPLIVSFFGRQSRLHGLINQVREDRKALYPPLPSWFRPKYVLEHVPYWSASGHRTLRYKVKQASHVLSGRNYRMIVNAQDEDTTRKRFLIPGAQFSANLYINENLYRPLDEHKIYDAIYTAQLQPFKRHWLAKDIESLMIVSYGGDLHSFCPSLRHADFNKEFLPRPELARKYNQSYAGLCLSETEGAMLASCEYLLCGIPIVSTYSKGGRDEFFNEQNSIIVPPEPEAIAKAVYHWKVNPPDPIQIRQQVLDRMNYWRYEYCEYVASLIKQGGGGKEEPEVLVEKYFGSSEGTLARFVKLDDLWQINPEDFI